MRPDGILGNDTYRNTDDQKRIDQWFYHPPKGDQVDRYNKINAKTKELLELIADICPPSREKATAMTNLQLVRMLANAAIACNEI